MKEKITERNEKIKLLEEKLSKLNGKWKNFIGDSIWLEEINLIKDLIKKVYKSDRGWYFNDPVRVY